MWRFISTETKGFPNNPKVRKLIEWPQAASYSGNKKRHADGVASNRFCRSRTRLSICLCNASPVVVMLPLLNQWLLRTTYIAFWQTIPFPAYST